MNKISGKVVAKENGIGVPDLLVVAYDCDPKTLPEGLCSRANRSSGSDIIKIQGDRLGSVLTDQFGGFALEYEDSQSKMRLKEKRPDLLLCVMPPEDSSLEEHPCLLHISDVRQNAGRLETYLIKLPAERLSMAGISMPGMPFKPDPGVDSDDFLAKMKKIAAENRKKEMEDKRPFSERYIERQLELAEEQKKTGIIQRQPLSFNLALPIRISGEEDTYPEATIVRAEKEDHYLFKSDPKSDSIELTFDNAKSSAGSFGLIVDKEKKTFSIALPSSPMHLELSESGPSALYQFYTAKRRSIEAG